MKNLIFLILIFFSKSIFAFDYSIQHYSSDNNELPQNSIKSIIQDKYGYTWLPTENGLVRFDGQNFKVYNSSNIDQIISNRFYIFNGSVDKDSIFVINDSNQIVLIHNRAVEFHSVKECSINLDFLKHSFFHNIDLVQTGFYVPGINEYFKISLNINEFYIFGKDSIYHQEKDILISKRPYKINNRSVFVSVNKNVVHFKNNKEYSIISIDTIIENQLEKPVDEDFSVLTNNSTNQTFLISQDTLYKVFLENSNIRLEYLNHGFDFVKNNIKSIFYDIDNNLIFLGSITKGLFILKKKEFQTIIKNNENNIFYAINHYQTNEILTSRGDLIIDNKISKLADLSEINSLYSLLIDNDKNIWAINAIYLTKIDIENNKYKILKEFKFNDILTVGLKFNEEELILGFQSKDKKIGNIYIFNHTTNLLKNIAQVDGSPLSIKLLEDSILWIGTEKSLTKFNLNSNVITEFPELKNKQIRSIYARSKSEVWITTYTHGFFHIKNQNVTSFPVDKNEYLLTSHCIIEDNQNYFWISTNKGLFQVKRNCLLNYVENNNYKYQYRYYSLKSGFNTNEFNGGCNPCGVLLDNNKIAFPSMDGVVIFNPNDIEKNIPISKLYIDNVFIDNDEIDLEDTIYLNKSFDRLKIQYSTPFYYDFNNLDIDYKLNRNGKEGNWFEIDDNLTATFSNLEYGNYTLISRIQSNLEGDYLYNNLYIIVPKPFWLKWWFMVLIFFTLLILFFLIYRWRLNYLKSQNTELSIKILERTNDLKKIIEELNETQVKLSKQNNQFKKLLSSITHDIKSPLKYLSYTSKYLFENTDEKNKDLKKYSKSIYSSSQQIYLFIENLLEYSKLQTSDKIEKQQEYILNEIIDNKIKLFSNIAKSNNTVIKSNIDETINLNINKHILSVIIHNILDNSTKYTKNGYIEIDAIIKNHKIKISIKDNGLGMKKEIVNFYNNLAKNYNNLENTKSISKGLGLNMVIELISLIEGEIFFSSIENEGTEVKLYFDYLS